VAGASERDAFGAQQRDLLFRVSSSPGATYLTAMVDHAVRRDIHVVGTAGQGVADEAGVARPAKGQREIAVRCDVTGWNLRDKRVDGLVKTCVSYR